MLTENQQIKRTADGESAREVSWIVIIKETKKNIRNIDKERM
jgi:hypothetical protein